MANGERQDKGGREMEGILIYYSRKGFRHTLRVGFECFLRVLKPAKLNVAAY